VPTPHRYGIGRRVQRAKGLYPPAPGKHPRALNKESKREAWTIELRTRDAGDAPHPVVERPTAYLVRELARC